MQGIKPTWNIARQISGRHTIISGKITNLAILLSLIVLTGVFLVQGKSLSFELYLNFIIDYRRYIMPSILLFHFGPSNLYAITRVLQYQFKDFHLVVYGHKQPVANHGELPTQINSNL